jgi:acyl-CoA reductase-like NAD-dependent aldehyde dehydrogenase
LNGGIRYSLVIVKGNPHRTYDPPRQPQTIANPVRVFIRRARRSDCRRGRRSGRKEEWAAPSLGERASVFLRAADLLTGKYRYNLLAATMLGQSKTVHQAEIDAICEVADFFRWNAHFLTRIYSSQPWSGPGEWNRMAFRPRRDSSTP